MSNPTLIIKPFAINGNRVDIPENDGGYSYVTVTTSTGDNPQARGWYVVDYTYVAATPVSTDNPSARGWYEYDSTTETYSLSTDTSVVSSKTYYIKTQSGYKLTTDTTVVSGTVYYSKKATGSTFFSQDLGFPTLTSTATINGGKPPRREDFNGVFYMLSRLLFFVQKGYVFEYDSTQDYYKHSMVWDNSALYFCINDCPVASTIAPHSDTSHTYWKTFDDIVAHSWGDITGSISENATLTAALAAKENVLTWDNTPTASSTNPVKSGGVYTSITSHTSNTSNPHSVTKTQVGLGNVVNTGDGSAPVENGTTKFTTGGAYTYLKEINDKIPTAATSSNQLADKDFVNSSINALAAFYITKNANGEPFDTRAELFNATTFYCGGVERVPSRNDYAIVLADEQHDGNSTRYTYNNGWEYQYTYNMQFTQVQTDAINSGITSSLVTQYSGYSTGKQNTLTWDSTPTNSSSGAMTSGAIYTSMYSKMSSSASTSDKLITTSEVDTKINAINFSDLQNIPSTFTPPIATSSTLGGVKIGNNIQAAADGTISVDLSQIDASSFDWTRLNTSEKLINDGSNGTLVVDGANGAKVHVTSATTITMPYPTSGVATWVTIWATSGSVTFTEPPTGSTTIGKVYFDNDDLPETAAGKMCVYTLASIGNGAWYCLFSGIFSNS